MWRLVRRTFLLWRQEAAPGYLEGRHCAQRVVRNRRDLTVCDVQ